MILQEIEKARDDIQAVQDAIDQIYGIYIVHFPELIAKMTDLRAMQQAIMMAAAAAAQNVEQDPSLTHIPETGDTSNCKDLMVVPQESKQEAAEDAEVDDTEVKKENRAKYRKLHRKCLSLCHPDKTSRFRSSVRIQLHNMFYEVREIQHSYYHSQLITFYVMIRVWRNEEHLLDESMLVPMRTELNALKQDFNELLAHDLCKVIVHHREGRRMSAIEEFETFLLKQIHAIEEEIKEA